MNWILLSDKEYNHYWFQFMYIFRYIVQNVQKLILPFPLFFFKLWNDFNSYFETKNRSDILINNNLRNSFYFHHWSNYCPPILQIYLQIIDASGHYYSTVAESQTKNLISSLQVFFFLSRKQEIIIRICWKNVWHYNWIKTLIKTSLILFLLLEILRAQTKVTSTTSMLKLKQSPIRESTNKLFNYKLFKLIKYLWYLNQHNCLKWTGENLLWLSV